MEVTEGKATMEHEGKHLDEAERLALADSTGKAVHSNSESSSALRTRPLQKAFRKAL